VFVGGVRLELWGVVLVVCVCRVGGVVFCMCVCGLLIFSPGKARQRTVTSAAISSDAQRRSPRPTPLLFLFGDVPDINGIDIVALLT